MHLDPLTKALAAIWLFIVVVGFAITTALGA